MYNTIVLRRYRIFGCIIIFAIFIFISDASSTPTFTHNQSAISKPNISAMDYTIFVTAVSGPTGIIENIPSGLSYQNSSIPEHQVRKTDTQILFSLPDGGDLNFTLTGSKCVEGFLNGSQTNYLTGETVPLTSFILSDGIIRTCEREQFDTPGYEIWQQESPGFGIIMTTFALLFMMGYMRRRKNL